MREERESYGDGMIIKVNDAQSLFEEMADRLKIDAAAGRHVGDGCVSTIFSISTASEHRHYTQYS